MGRSRLSRYSSLLMMALGIVSILFVSILVGIVLTMVGLAMFLFYRRLSNRSQALPEDSRRKGSVEVEKSPSGSGQNVVKEKEIHIVVRIPCKHCGVLNDQLRTRCESCGAPLK